ncbi:MAG TPA: AMP-binding protein, partial [Blastocatellia bacterium]|nr:AMP-binding protein [Blastocatellia bacterium]
MGLKGDISIWIAEDFGVKLLNTTIGDLLDLQAATYPEKEALVYSYPEIELNLRLNYRQYREEADRLARALIAIGIRKGENVGVWAPNVPEWALLSLALAKIGAVLVTINTAYKTAELEYVLHQGDITTLFMTPEHRGNSYVDSVYSVIPELRTLSDPLNEPLACAALPKLKRVVLIGTERQVGLAGYRDLLGLSERSSQDELQRRQASVRADDVAQMQYTSGTTGFPKAVMLTHHNLINQTHVCTLRGRLKNDERQVTGMPFFHVAGCVGGILFSLYLGGTLIPLISFDPVKQLELFEKERATMSFNVPTMLIAMLNHPRFQSGEFDLSSLRMITTGATPVPVSLMEEVKTKMGAECSVVYGMTEISGAVTQSMHEDGFELKAATVGLPLPHMDVKVVDTVTGEPVALGQSGELLVRGPLVMTG